MNRSPVTDDPNPLAFRTIFLEETGDASNDSIVPDIDIKVPKCAAAFSKFLRFVSIHVR